MKYPDLFFNNDLYKITRSLENDGCVCEIKVYSKVCGGEDIYEDRPTMEISYKWDCCVNLCVGTEVMMHLCSGLKQLVDLLSFVDKAAYECLKGDDYFRENHEQILESRV